MTVSLRRLGPGDESLLARLATEDADFDLEERAAPRRPLDPARARDYLANPAVLHWIVSASEELVGHLYCLLVPLRSGDGQELLLYEIGVRRAWRRRGVGRALLAHMEGWMQENGIREVWVLADNEGAVAFYQDSGFAAEAPQPLYMTRTTAADAR